MDVPVSDNRSKNAWTFLEPWTWDLGLTTCCFFIFIGFVVWVLEHRINNDFRGPPSHQVGTGVWFSFSTIVFSHRERVVSNLARFVMSIWIFVVLILTINYTASLASLYTVQQLQPSVTNIKDLIRKGESIGYLNNSYVYDILKQVGFDDSKIKRFRTMRGIDEALSKGSGKVGVAAVVDQTPNMKLFVAKYCSKYTMIGPIFKTDGFGFVFPERSLLIPDVSQAILKVTGTKRILDIKKKWFKEGRNCQDLNSPKVSSNSLGLESIWVLFLISGVASILALIIFIASFIYRHGHILMHPADSEASTWRNILTMLKNFQ